MLTFSNRRRSVVTALTIMFLAGSVCRAAPKPVPPSPYLPIAYRYVDAMLKQGRDTQGEQKTGLLLSALDRAKPGPLADRPAAPAGVDEASRADSATGPLVGANPQHDQNLLRVLYALRELSNKPLYAEAADAELKWFLQNASPDAPVAAWDNGSAWDVATDKLISADKQVSPDATRPWMLWDRCFEIAPNESKRLVQGLIAASAADTATPRRTGATIRALAVAYQHTGDQSLLKAIEAALGRLEKERAAGKSDPASEAAWLSAAIDCDGVASRLPTELATRLKAFAASVDQGFCALPHDLPGKGGFAVKSSGEKSDVQVTPLWQANVGGLTTAQVGMMCVSRTENTGSVNYRKLMQAAADAYRDKLPPDDVDAWPMTYGHAISLQLAAWRATSNQVYLDQARKLADAAVQTFWGDDQLPRASTKSKHYESITGGDTLTLSLIDLHLSILGITAVRTPPNTIDR